MIRRPTAGGLVMLLTSLAALALTSGRARAQEAGSGSFRRHFDLSGCSLSTAGRSRYAVLEPGHRLVLEGREDDGEEVRVAVTVLDDTARVDGHPTRVVEEREWAGGRLAEVSRNFVALCPATGDLYYFGEDVDIYEDGEVVGHEGAWRAGRDGARPGLLLPGRPEVGQGYYQEVAPGVAMDRARVVSTHATAETPAGTYRGCLAVRESTPLEPGSGARKLYAPGVGVVVDESLRVVRVAGPGSSD